MNGTGSVAPEVADIRDRVRAAFADGEPLQIHGGGSKRTLLGRAGEGTPLPMDTCRGVVSYRPQEMVLTARAGTRISELVAATADAGQCLPFEPMQRAGATLGGTVATNLSGPARPWRGAVRDAVLGVRIINGRGELLRFGGEVMKNVAGYDVSRLQCGALGTLGVIVEVSLRLLPQPRGQRTLGWQCDAQEALAIMREARARPLPCTGACWFDDTLFLRLTGDAPALDAAQSQLPGGCSETADGPWAALRDCTLPAQQGPGLWALSVAPATPLDGGPPALLDWAGARRYYRGRQAQEMHAMASAGSGHAWRLGGGEDDDDVLAAPPTPLATLQLRLKQALDPARILNRGRLYRWH